MTKNIIQYEELYLKWLVYKYPNNEIKKGTQLLVRTGQKVVLSTDGKICDIFEPGSYILENGTIPKMILLGQKFGFPKNTVKTDVYFINTTAFMNNGWGTKDPVIRKDKDLSFVRLTAFGKYTFKLENPVLFLTEVFGARTIGTETQETVKYISDKISQAIVKSLAESKFSLIDMSLHYDEIGNELLMQVNQSLPNIGVKVTEVIVENIGTTKSVNEVIDDVTGMNLVKDKFEDYERFKKAKLGQPDVSRPGMATLENTNNSPIYGKEVVNIVDK